MVKPARAAGGSTNIPRAAINGGIGRRFTYQRLLEPRNALAEQAARPEQPPAASKIDRCGRGHGIADADHDAH
jgi:hypothetical protein